MIKSKNTPEYKHNCDSCVSMGSDTRCLILTHNQELLINKVRIISDYPIELCIECLARFLNSDTEEIIRYKRGGEII